MPCTRSLGRGAGGAADRRLRDGERVGRVDAALGERGRVRRLAVVVHVELVDRRASSGSTMSSGAGCTIIAACTPSERAALEQQDLAAAVLLRRRPDHAHREAHVVGDARQARARADRARGDHVVAARVARCRAGSRTPRRSRRAAAPSRARDERRRQIAHAAFDAKARRVERVGDPRRRALLLEAELRVRVDAMRQRDERVARIVDQFTRGGPSHPWRRS
jgi:hypothetical protein